MNDKPEGSFLNDGELLKPYAPVNPVATFVDQYGDRKTIHRKRGARLSVAKECLTPQQRMNRAVAVLTGRAVRARRLAQGLSQRELCVRAGLINVNPNQYVSALENAPRQEGMRFGTLYALSMGLECSPFDLLPKIEDVIKFAGIKTTVSIAR